MSNEYFVNTLMHPSRIEKLRHYENDKSWKFFGNPADGYLIYLQSSKTLVCYGLYHDHLLLPNNSNTADVEKLKNLLTMIYIKTGITIKSIR